MAHSLTSVQWTRVIQEIGIRQSRDYSCIFGVGGKQMYDLHSTKMIETPMKR